MAMRCGNERCCALTKIVLAILGIVAGLSAFPTFTFTYGNVQAGLWALVSAVYAGAVLNLHLLMYKRRLDRYFSPKLLMHIAWVGFISQLAALVALITYIVIAVQQKQGMGDYANNNYIRAVWAFMTWKWSFQLLFFSYQYRKKLLIEPYSEIKP